MRQWQLLLIPRHGVLPPHRPAPLVELFALEQSVNVGAETDAESVSDLRGLSSARSMDPGLELNGVCDACPVSASLDCCHSGHPIAVLVPMAALRAACRAISQFAALESGTCSGTANGAKSRRSALTCIAACQTPSSR